MRHGNVGSNPYLSAIGRCNAASGPRGLLSRVHECITFSREKEDALAYIQAVLARAALREAKVLRDVMMWVQMEKPPISRTQNTRVPNFYYRQSPIHRIEYSSRQSRRKRGLGKNRNRPSGGGSRSRPRRTPWRRRRGGAEKPGARALPAPARALCAHPACLVSPPDRFIEISRDYEKRRDALRDLSRPSNDGDDFVPSAAFTSFRTAASTLRSAIAMRSGRSPGRKLSDDATDWPAVEEEDAAADLTDEEIPTEELFSAMQGQWVEVECLLRVQLRTPDALDEARQCVSSSLDFNRLLGELATSSGVLKGAIFQALLAFVDGRVESTAASVGVEMSDGEWEGLSAGADALRKLVRIKVQDDNDLKAAHSALSSCDEFFRNLELYSTREALEQTAVLTMLEEAF